MFQTILSCEPAISAKCAVMLAERLCFAGPAIHCFFCPSLMVVLNDFLSRPPVPNLPDPRCQILTAPHPQSSLSAVGWSYRYLESLPSKPPHVPLIQPCVIHSSLEVVSCVQSTPMASGSGYGLGLLIQTRFPRSCHITTVKSTRN